MKNSLILFLFLFIGVAIGMSKLFSVTQLKFNLTENVLYILVLFVGIGIGGNSNIWEILRNINIRIFLVPVAIIIGSLLGASLSTLIIRGLSLKEAMAVGGGLGYYSLSSVIIMKYHGETLSVIALLANLMRELVTLLFTPLLARFFGRLAPIACGGATSSDTTLPIIVRSVGEDFAIVSLVSGIILTILVPVIVTIIIR